MEVIVEPFPFFSLSLEREKRMNGVEMAFIRILERGLEEEQKRVIRSSETSLYDRRKRSRVSFREKVWH